MQINNSPERFAALFKDALFEIAAESEEPTDVKILNSESQTIGVKRFLETEPFIVNVAHYFGDSIKVEPCVADSPNVFLDNDRLATVKIRVENSSNSIDSESIPMLYARVGSSEGELLNKMPEPKTIYRNSCEQIDLWLDGQSLLVEIETSVDGVTESYQWGTLATPSGLVSIMVNAPKIMQLLDCANQTMPFRLKITVGDAVRYVEYLLMSSADEPLSLKWLNEFGAIESHPFDSICAQTREADARGCRLSLLSEPEDGAVIKWLSGIISAERVWLVVEGRVMPVEVVTDKVEILANQLQRIVIEVALPNEILFN